MTWLKCRILVETKRSFGCPLTGKALKSQRIWNRPLKVREYSQKSKYSPQTSKRQGKFRELCCLKKSYSFCANLSFLILKVFWKSMPPGPLNGLGLTVDFGVSLEMCKGKSRNSISSGDWKLWKSLNCQWSMNFYFSNVSRGPTGRATPSLVKKAITVIRCPSVECPKIKYTANLLWSQYKVYVKNK